MKIITGPTVEPITLAEAKLQCRVTSNAEDTLFTSYIKAAREMVEHKLHRFLVNKTAEISLDCFSKVRIPFPVSDVSQVVSIKYFDAANVEQTLTASLYELGNKNNLMFYVCPVLGTAWPSTYAKSNAVTIRFTAGYGTDASAVPESIKQWIKLAVDTMYRNRGLVTEQGAYTLPERFCDSLLDAHRTYL